MIENREETKKGKKEGREGEKEGEKERTEGEKKENERKLYRVMRWTSKVGTGGRLGVGDANPEKAHGQKSLRGYSLWGRRVGHNQATSDQKLKEMVII